MQHPRQNEFPGSVHLHRFCGKRSATKNSNELLDGGYVVGYYADGLQKNQPRVSTAGQMGWRRDRLSLSRSSPILGNCSRWPPNSSAFGGQHTLLNLIQIAFGHTVSLSPGVLKTARDLVPASPASLDGLMYVIFRFLRRP